MKRVDANHFVIGDQTYSLNHNIHVLAFGKAVLGMSQAVHQILGDHVVDGVVTIPVGLAKVLAENNKRSGIHTFGENILTYINASISMWCGVRITSLPLPMYVVRGN